MKNWDFGYFGKGIDGYMQYKTAFDRNQKQNQGTIRPTSKSVNKEIKPERQEDSAKSTADSTSDSVDVSSSGLSLEEFVEQSRKTTSSKEARELTGPDVFIFSVLFVLRLIVIIIISVYAMVLLIQYGGFLGLILAIFIGSFVWKLCFK